MLTRNYDS